MPIDTLPSLPSLPHCEVRHIPGFLGYAACSDGTILSYLGSHGFRRSWKPLRGNPNRQNYLRYALCRDGRVFYRSGHQLVLEAFVGPCPEGLEGCHENGNPSDNRLENLRWDTRRKNHEDKRKHGTAQAGEKHGMAKITAADVREMRALHASGWSVRNLMSRYDLSDTHIYKIILKQLWKDV